MLNTQSEPKQIHHNIPQLLFNLVRAHITLCFWGRGTGKTEGPGVDFTLYNALTMPRSLGGLVSVSYDKLLTFILPKIIKGWERYGYIEGVHFWSRKFAPEHLKRKRPYLSPTQANHFVHLYNGSGLQLISLDRAGISNAADLDYIYADECKLYDYEKFKEVLHTNRGNDEHFGHLSQHHSILYTTDRPSDSSGDWLYDIADKADPELFDLIMMIQQRIYELQDEIANARTKKSRNEKLKLIEGFEEQLNEARSEMVYVSEASTLDNVHALGADIIKDLKRSLSDIVYRLSVLNERVKEVEDGFYKDLEESHGSYATNHKWIDRQEIDIKNAKADCRWYNDSMTKEPLDIGMDFNGKITNVLTGQDSGKGYRFLHSGFHRGKLQDLFRKVWHPFWEHHECKVVNFYYDHTTIGVKADSDNNYADEVINILKQLGWHVNAVFIGQQPTHRSRYLLWERILSGSDNDLPTFTFNRSTCEYWYDVCKQTGTIINRDGFGKDKRDEKKKNFDQTKAPHITDAGDTLLLGAVYFNRNIAATSIETGSY